MAGNLAIPSFVAGPRNDLATVDIYMRSDNQPVNNIQGPGTFLQASTGFDLRGGKSMLGSLPNLKNLLTQGKNLLNGKGDVAARLLGASSLISNGIRSLAPGVQSGILGSIGNVAKITATIGGITRQVSSGNIASIASIGSLINGISGNTNTFSLSDRGATVGAYAGVMNQALKAGIPNSFSAITSGITNKNVLTQIIGKVLPTVIGKSDLGSLTSIANIAAPGAIKLLSPNILNTFTSNFKSAPGTDFLGRIQNYTNINTTFTKIDPLWSVANRLTSSGTDNILNATALQSASLDFKKTFKTGVLSNPLATTSQQMLLVGSLFKSTNVISEINKLFPMTSLQALKPIVNNGFVNPQTLQNIRQTNTLGSSDPINGTTTSLQVFNNPDGSKREVSDITYPDGTRAIKTTTYSRTGAILSTTYTYR